VPLTAELAHEVAASMFLTVLDMARLLELAGQVLADSGDNDAEAALRSVLDGVADGEIDGTGVVEPS
jgi:hypothetical protein